MISRRNVVLMSALLTGGCANMGGLRNGLLPFGARSKFVRVEGQRFLLNGETYRFAGANLWYAAYLGALGPTGNRNRLLKELDLLASLGVTNLRVMGASELSPLKNSLTPAFRGAKPPYNEDLLGGLDFLLAEMGKRDMKAVVCLGNHWEWSGGFATYLYWTNGGHLIDRADGHSAEEFADFASGFFSKPEAVALYRDYVATLIGRTNSVTGTLYRDDPTIMTWQLANEPRPGATLEVGLPNLPPYYAWIADTAAFIKARDPVHLVSAGSEGLHSCLDLEDVVLKTHAIADIDYLTFHTWPQNWRWVDPDDLPGTYSQGEMRSRNYVRAHIAMAEQLNKPAVAEEFGFPRDKGYEPGSPTTFKDRFYDMMFTEVLDNARAGGPLAGWSFWAWGGMGRAQHENLRMQRGDTSYVGDPPHEPQGWYSVFDVDASTHDVIRRHAAALKALG
ncbi:MAG: mannanase [Rhizomicrobium sp.]|jgi:mannan endo-1,4-beta-mannosidase